MIRWIYFLILVLLAVVVQTSVMPVIWFRTPLGYVGPELLAAVAVFVALHVRSRTEAALAGWTLGFAVDLTLSGPGMGVPSLLYMVYLRARPGGVEISSPCKGFSTRHTSGVSTAV